MNELCHFFVVLLLSTSSKVQSEQACAPGSEKCTSVLSHTFQGADLSPKTKLLGEVQTFAELKYDLRSSLPNSFTICSTVMATKHPGYYPIFFNLVDDQQGQIIAPWFFPSIEGRLGIYFATWSTDAIYNKIPPIFSNHWYRSCVAINSSSQSIDWVVEGSHVLKSQKVREPLGLPQSLILGALWYGGKWKPVSNKVTNLNIFSSALSIERMKRMTGDTNCVENEILH